MRNLLAAIRAVMYAAGVSAHVENRRESISRNKSMENTMHARWLCIPAVALTIFNGPASAVERLTMGALVGQHATTQEQAPEALAKKSGCLECHSVDKTIKGPSFHDVAARYKADARARDVLIEKVKRGGKGNWTEITHGIPMPPHSRILSTAETERLVDWVLSR